MKIAFLLYNAYGIGGTIRSTTNLSRALSARHDVELVSVYQTADAPRLPLGPRVRLVPLIDWRKDSPGYDGALPEASHPTTLYRDGPVAASTTPPSALTDRRVAAYLRETDADVVIATRPVLAGYLARFGTGRQIRIGQEHLLLRMHDDRLRSDQNAALSHLDGFVTVSERDAADYRAALPGVATRIECIPNCSPGTDVEPSTGDSRTVVAAGRLIPVKRYERLIDAFAKVAAAHPDWHLRLYGRGPQKAALRARVEDRGLSNHVRLMGAVAPIEPEWAKGAIAAVSSDFESFGMTILEAMHCGVPVVATDCPYGPGEIITHGENGLLSPLDGGPDAYADMLIGLIGDEEQRRRLAAAGMRRAADYTPEVIASRYEEFIGELAARHGGRGAGRNTGLGARLRRAVRGALPAARREAGEDPVGREPDPRPTAWCRVAPDGGLRVTVTDAAPPSRAAQRVDLLLRKRRDPQQQQVRLPMAPVAAPSGGRAWAATVERAAHTLSEGRWDCFVVPRGAGIGQRVRLVAAQVEQQALLTLPPVVDGHGVSSWIPYPTSDGYLAVRAWLRPAHAEVEEVHVDAGAVTVTAVLLGGAAPPAEWTATARGTAVSREGAGFDVEAGVEPLGGRRFSLRVPLPGLLERCSVEQDLWDVTVRPHPEGPVVPLGRITGDTVDRKGTDTFPAVERGHPERGPVRIRPYFTAHNALAISARDLAPGDGRDTAGQPADGAAAHLPG